MKKISICILLILGLIISCTGDRNDKIGLLWKITSPDEKVGFVYGTIHLYPKDRLKISNKVFSTLGQCKTLALERNIRDSVDQKKFIESTKRVNSFLRTYQVISDKYGAGLTNMEAELITYVNSKDIKLTGLETSDELINFMTKVSTIDNGETDEYTIELYELTIDIYKSELIDYYANTHLNKELGIETRKLLVDKRNENWIDNIEKLINQDNVFIAVGMGHLGGENGLLKLLEKRGYKLERIEI